MPTRNVAKGKKQQCPTVEGVARTHPIVPIVLAKNNHVTNSTLTEFLEQQLSGTKKQIPFSLHEFYGNYLEYVVQRHLRLLRSQEGPRYYHWNIRDAIDRLSKLAFISCVRGSKITANMVLKQMAGVGLEKEAGDVTDIEFRSLGLLVEDGTSGRNKTYRFKEEIILEYLVANYHLLQCLKALTAAQTDKVITGVLLDSMSKLPTTGDIWRITFGLLNADAHTKDVQSQILEEIIDVSKRTEGMTSFDVTSLCVEAIYESQNAGELTSLLDEFSMNQTLNYSNVFMSKARISYTMQAAGYLVRASPHVYGLHLSNLGLNEEKIGLLADPVNAVSDNNLQVLNLSCNPLGQSGMRRLQRFIVKASLLTHLDISECQLDGVSIAMLSEFFMCLPLRYLNLDNNAICDSGLLHMLSNLKYVPTLEVLNMANNQLTDRSIVPLGEKIVEFLPNLRTVDLNKNLMQEAGLISMSKALPGLAHIEEVRIAENVGENLRATEVITHTWKSKSLKHININMNQIPPEGVLTLTKVGLTHSDAIPLADEDDDVDEAMDTTDFHDNDDTLDSTFNQSHDFDCPPKLQDSQNVRLLMQDTWEKSQSMDLLAGRPDKVRAVPLRRSTSRAGSLPRVKDMRRSWHGVSSNLRNSFRNTRESLASRSSLRGAGADHHDNTGEEEDLHSNRSPGNHGDIGNHDDTISSERADRNDRANNSMKRSSGSNLRENIRKSTSNLKDSVLNTGSNIRDSFRKKFSRRSSPNKTAGRTIETTV